jgi:hypothetical protein
LLKLALRPPSLLIVKTRAAATGSQNLEEEARKKLPEVVLLLGWLSYSTKAENPEGLFDFQTAGEARDTNKQ